jgi:GAF domain-containing protein/HAMP domain-containing protein
LLLLGIALNYVFVSRLNRALVVMEEEMERANAALEVGKAAADLFSALSQGTLNRDADDFTQIVREAEQSLLNAEERLTESAGSLPLDDPVQIELYGLRTRTVDIRDLANRLLLRAEEGIWWHVEQLVLSMVPFHRGLVIESVEQMQVLTTERRIVAVAEAEAARRMMRVAPTVVGLLIVGVAMGTVFVTVRSITRPVERLTDAAARLAAGHLEERVRIERVDEFSRLATAFNEMANQLEISYGQLEQRVAERTRELETSAATLSARGKELEDALGELQKREAELEDAVRLQQESRRHQEEANRELWIANEAIRRRSVQFQATTEVSRVIAQVRDPDELLSQVTQLISQRFGFYHVGIFLVDEAGRDAVLRAANSKGGQRMLTRGHRLRVGEQGIVGHVIGAGRPRIALDVGADPVHFDNPDLPETRSEMALPLRRGDEIIGALDVQSVEPAAFDDQDVAVFQTLADQVSVALENAHLFTQAQDALAKVETVHQQYLLQEWQRYAQQAADLSHEYLLSGWESLAGQPLPAGDAALTQGSIVAFSADTGDQEAALAVPIKLHGQVIGVLDLQETDENRRWTEEEIALAEAVAEQLALALESARLFEQTQARARREALTRQITERIRDAMDVDAMLQTAVRELGQALGAPRVYVRLATDAGGHVDGDGVKSSVTATPISPDRLETGQRGE